MKERILDIDKKLENGMVQSMGRCLRQGHLGRAIVALTGPSIDAGEL